MAANYSKPSRGSPLSESQLRKKLGDNALHDFLSLLACADKVRHFNDFLRPISDALVAATNNDHFIYTTVGGTATTWAHVAHQSGIIRGVSGTTAATSGLEVHSPVMYSGDQFAGMEIRHRNSVVTERRTEVGFASTQPAVSTAYVNSLSTPTFNTTANGALWVHNHTGSTYTMGLYTIGTAIAAAKTAVTTTASRMVNDTFKVVRVQLFTDMVEVWLGETIGTASSQARHVSGQYIEGGTLAALTYKCIANSTTDANNDLDYLHVWQNRL